MRHPALLAAELSGRPLLMRETSVLPYAQMLGVAVSGERPRTPFAALMGRARKLVGGRPDVEAMDGERRLEPMAYAPRWMGEPDDTGFGWTLKDGVAIIAFDGPLMAEGFGWDECWYHGYDTLLQAYDEAQADARVLGVWFRVKSPGGVAHDGLAILAKRIRETRAAAGGKPVWFWCEQSFSAAYWITAQGDRVEAGRMSGVGSIGAVITHCEFSKMLENDGITVTPFRFGAKKTDGSPLEKLSETATEDFGADVEQCGQWFVDDVIAGRPSLSREAVIATQAGCYFGDSDNPDLSGLKIGLIDAVKPEREAFAAFVDHLANLSPAGPPANPDDQEIEMSIRTKIAAVRADASLSEAEKGRQIDAILAEGPAEGDDAAEDEADGEDKDAPAPEAAEEDEETNDPKAAKAIMNLPEAKGRTALAQELAFTPGMSVETAKRLLAKSGKASTLGERMSDPNLSGGGGGEKAKDVKIDANAIYDKRRKAERQGSARH